MRINRRNLVIGGAALGAVALSPRAVAAAAADKAAVESNLLTAVSLTNRPLTRLNIADRMARYGVPGASITIIRDGRLAWSGAYGVRRAGGAPVTLSTIFQAASLSKPLTALGALRLVNASAIGLKDDVNTHLQSWRLPFAANVPPQPITLSQLLSHTAGVNVEGFPGFKSSEPRPTLRAILDGAPEAKTPRVEVSEPPGPSKYSGGGYMVVEQLIEDLTRTSFAAHMQRNVLDAIGMPSSTFEPIPPQHLAADIASGHSWQGKLRDDDWLIYPQHAAASLWSTTADLARFLTALIASHRGAAGALLKRESYTDSAIARTFGTKGVVPSTKPLSHSGWNTGYRSYIAAFPETGDGIAVMTNADRGHDLIMEIVRAAAHVYRWPAFAPERVKPFTASEGELDSLTGKYEFTRAGFQVTVSREDDHFRIAAPRGDYTFYPTSRWSHSLDLIAVEDGQRGAFVVDGGLTLHLWGMQARPVA